VTTRSLQDATSHLPVPPTSLVAREREREAIGTLMLRPDLRLLTLTGAGGVGKTRLALAVASDLAADFPDGVWFVALAQVRDPALFIPTAAAALGVPEAGDQPMADGLIAHLRSRRLLLIFDNFEQVTDAAALLVTLLEATPGVSALVTSRERLRVSGEHVLPVAPLALPVAPDQHGPATTCSLAPDVALTSPAVRLFVERARAVCGEFQLDRANTALVVQVCCQLDGLPLALELAAARLREFSISELAARLDPRLPVLIGGDRDLPARLQTMHSAIAWSYDLLTSHEQALFRRLAVFAGGFTLEAAEEVTEGVRVSGCQGDGRNEKPVTPSPRHPVTLNVLASLVDKNLLRQVQGRSGQARYEMLETVREYAQQRLAEAGDVEIHRAHVAWCLQTAERSWDAMWVNPIDVPVLDAMADEHDNMRAALTRCEASGDLIDELRLAAALCPFWYLHSHRAEGRRWLDRGLATAAETGIPPPIPVSVYARALYGAAMLREGEPDSEPFLEACLALWRESGERWGIGASLSMLALLANNQGEHQRAATLCDEALATFQPGEAVWIAEAQLMRGRADLGMGESRQAATWFEAALAHVREVEDAHGIGLALNNLALVALRLGELQVAAAHLDESMSVWRGIARLEGFAHCLAEIAMLAAATGQIAAARLWGVVDRLREIAGYEFPLPESEDFARAEAVSRADLGVSAFDPEFAAGQALGLDEALATTAAVIARATAPPESVPTDRLGLTPRELEVLRLVAEGRSDREIAAELSISRRTAMKHVSNILRKLDVESRTAAAAIAYRDGIA
jgi:non-specific serine/threonine protein kinase